MKELNRFGHWCIGKTILRLKCIVMYMQNVIVLCFSHLVSKYDPNEAGEVTWKGASADNDETHILCGKGVAN